MKTSVALCTFNGEKYLKEQLDSILSQNVAVDEIVIFDDVSTDNTRFILKDYETRFPAIFRIFFNENNLGYVGNFENALSLCTGDIIFLSDQDDVWYSDKISSVNHYFQKNPSIGVVAHNLDLTGNYKGEKTFWQLKNFSAEIGYSNEELLKEILLNGNVFPGMTLAIRKKTLQEYLPLEKTDSLIIHDYEIIIKALREQKFGVLNKILAAYRQHDAQSIGFIETQSSSISDLTEIQLLSQHYLRVKNYITIFKLNPKIKEDFKKEIKEKYSLFLKKFPFPKRIFIHLKSKYYYRIIHF